MQTMPVDQFIPILFKVLFGFVGLNIVVNFVLLYTRRLRMYKLMAIYWPLVLLMFAFQGIFQSGNLAVVLSYSLCIFTGSTMAVIGHEAIGRKFPWKKYACLFAAMYPLTIYLDHLGFGFTVVALPFSVSIMLPLLQTFYFIHVVDRRTTTRLQKVLGILYVGMAVHSLNFALFRMDQDAQLWGWLVSYAIYDMLAILLPAIALEHMNLTETERMQKLVDERTSELGQSLKVNEKLLKVLIHDISNPLTVIKGYLYLYSKGHDDKKFLISRIEKSQEMIEAIIGQVKHMHRLKNNARSLRKPVDIEECFSEIHFMFEAILREKQLTLEFVNELEPGTLVLAEQISLTHSVLSNLVSNGIKFSRPQSNIVISAREVNKVITLEVRDQGMGISKETIDDVMLNQEAYSGIGTHGERGSGMGLSIVKSFVDSYGGQLEIDSSLLLTDPGTSVRITLDRAPSQLS